MFGALAGSWRIAVCGEGGLCDEDLELSRRPGGGESCVLSRLSSLSSEAHERALCISKGYTHPAEPPLHLTKS